MDTLRKIDLSGRLTSWAIASALSIEVCVAVYLYPRHPHKDGASRGDGIVILALLLAGAIWLVLRAGVWLARRASLEHNDDVLGGGTWAVCLGLTGALVAYRGSQAHGFVGHHPYLIVSIGILLWAMLAFVLRVLVSLAVSLNERRRFRHASSGSG